MTLRSRLPVLALLASLALAPTGAVEAQDGKREEKRRQLLERLGKKLGVPAADLAAAGGERWASNDAAQRKAFLGDLGAKPRGALYPLVVEAALHEADFECRRTAVRLLSVVGLEADRAAYLASLPSIARLTAERTELIAIDAADQVVRLERWLQCDAEAAQVLERAFRCENLDVARRGLAALLQTHEPQLRRGLVTRAALEVLDRKSRFSAVERKQAVLAIPRLRDVATPGALAARITEDGPIAVEIATVLGELGDRSVVPALRRIDQTSSHALRVPVYVARGRLGDAQLLAELGAAIDKDHLNIQLAILEGLTHVEQQPRPGSEAGGGGKRGTSADAGRAPSIDEGLARLAAVVQEPVLRRAIAVARLARGDAADLALLQPLVEGDAPDGAVSDRALRIDHAPVAPLLRAIARTDAQGGRRHAALDRLGEPRFADDETRALLVKMAAEGDPSALRLRAAASLLQLAPPDGVGPITSAQGVAAVTSALIDLDVVSREDVSTEAGKARRFSGSPLIDVCERWARAEAVQAAPMIAAWLDPPAAAPSPAAPAGDGSRARGAAASTPTQAPTPPPFLAHPLVRRAAVQALGALAVALKGKTDPRSVRELDRAITALGRRLDDPASVVRAAATRALAHVSALDPLPLGSALALEAEVEAKVRRWLAERPAR